MIVEKNDKRELGNDKIVNIKIVNSWIVKFFADWLRLRNVRVPVLDCGGIFKDYELHKVQALSVDIAEIGALSLNYWMSIFVFNSLIGNDKRYCKSFALNIREI